MPRFEISARHEMSLGQGNWVHKGDSFNINITIPNTVRRAFLEIYEIESIVRQLYAQGIVLPTNSCWLNANHWEIKMK